jgi:hypothetical protein
MVVYVRTLAGKVTGSGLDYMRKRTAFYLVMMTISQYYLDLNTQGQEL